MSNNKQSSVDAYCNGCNAFICDELVTFEETCSNCGTQIEYFEDKMSNNKQIMKLYTEEQVLKMLEICRDSDLYEHILTFQDILKTETSIELPSDEEIEEALSYRIVEQISFRKGAKWMRNKIQGDNNEQE